MSGGVAEFLFDCYLRMQWDRLLPYLKSRTVNPPISATYPLARAGEAVAQLEKRNAFGKVVIDPSRS